MKIFGIGTDIVNIKRIEKILKNKKSTFKKKIFTENEILYCNNKRNPYPFYAKRFAAKEALSKALGTGINKDISFKNIQVSNDKKGKPYILLKGKTESFLKKKIKSKSYSIHLSLSDDTPWAQATVIISSSK
jgi:holo-[acyl-carrier protein] synthase